MTAEELLSFLHGVEPLKSRTRHCVTQAGVPETVAAHSWRLAVMALVLEELFPQVDMARVVALCLVHDIGEAVTGDVPSFQKTTAHMQREEAAVNDLLAHLPKPARNRLGALFAEMAAGETAEAKLFWALDKLEAVISHNESPLSTWLPLEYTLNQTYGEGEAAAFPFLAHLRQVLRAETIRKIAAEGLAENSAPKGL